VIFELAGDAQQRREPLLDDAPDSATQGFEPARTFVQRFDFPTSSADNFSAFTRGRRPLPGV
jgi:hypothetical protein